MSFSTGTFSSFSQQMQPQHEQQRPATSERFSSVASFQDNAKIVSSIVYQRRLLFAFVVPSLLCLAIPSSIRTTYLVISISSNHLPIVTLVLTAILWLGLYNVLGKYSPSSKQREEDLQKSCYNRTFVVKMLIGSILISRYVLSSLLRVPQPHEINLWYHPRVFAFSFYFAMAVSCINVAGYLRYYGMFSIGKISVLYSL